MVSSIFLYWCFLGDFNTILGAHHEQRSMYRTYIICRSKNNNNLIHLASKDGDFTWANERRGRHHTQRRLDRAICCQDWITT